MTSKRDIEHIWYRLQVNCVAEGVILRYGDSTVRHDGGKRQVTLLQCHRDKASLAPQSRDVTHNSRFRDAQAQALPLATKALCTQLHPKPGYQVYRVSFAAFRMFGVIQPV